MFYKKVTSRDHKWFFLLRYGDLKEGLEMWSSRISALFMGRVSLAHAGW